MMTAPARSQLQALQPRNATEELLAQLWSEMLGVERIGVHQDFFALGGHSLLAERLVEWLRGRGLAVPVRALFEATAG